MTTNTPPPSQASVEATFRNYSSKQAEGYAKGRGGYPPTLINFVMDHHRDTGGKTGIFLDVGCGPGNATRDLAPHFEIAFGTDAGDAMIKTATEIGGATATGAPIQFRVCPAEEIDEMKELEHGSVDMITSAVAVSTGSLLLRGGDRINDKLKGSLVRYAQVLGCSSEASEARRHRCAVDRVSQV